MGKSSSKVRKWWGGGHMRPALSRLQMKANDFFLIILLGTWVSPVSRSGLLAWHWKDALGNKERSVNILVPVLVSSWRNDQPHLLWCWSSGKLRERQVSELRMALPNRSHSHEVFSIHPIQFWCFCWHVLGAEALGWAWQAEGASTLPFVCNLYPLCEIVPVFRNYIKEKFSQFLSKTWTLCINIYGGQLLNSEIPVFFQLDVIEMLL